MKRCAQSPLNGEFTLCGDAFDAPETEDDVEPFEFVKSGETVTCDNCRFIIDEIHTLFRRGYKQK